MPSLSHLFMLTCGAPPMEGVNVPMHGAGAGIGSGEDVVDSSPAFVVCNNEPYCGCIYINYQVQRYTFFPFCKNIFLNVALFNHIILKNKRFF